MMKEARGVQSVEIAAKLLNVLVEQDAPIMLRDLASKAGIAPAQAHAYLVSLRRLGLVEQLQANGLYRLGPLALDLGITRMRAVDPLQMARSAVMALVQETGLTVALAVWSTFGPTIIQVDEGPDQLHMNTRAGTVYSVTGTATGRLFAAFLPKRLVRTVMTKEAQEKGTTGRIGSPQELTQGDIAAIRSQGYATIASPPVPGVNAISAPVFDYAGQMLLAITLIGPTNILSAKSKAVSKLLNATQRLSWELGFGTMADAAYGTANTKS